MLRVSIHLHRMQQLASGARGPTPPGDSFTRLETIQDSGKDVTTHGRRQYALEKVAIATLAREAHETGTAQTAACLVEALFLIL